MLMGVFSNLMKTLRSDVEPGSRVHPGDLAERAFKEYYNVIEPLRQIEDLSVFDEDGYLKIIAEIITKAVKLIKEERQEEEASHNALWNKIMTVGVEGVFDPKEFDEE